MATVHEYPVTVEWTGGREGTGKVTAGTSGQSVAIAVPPEFGGPGLATNPEELLTSAITSCYSITFGIISGNRKLPLKELNVQGIGEVEQQGANFVYRRITLKPTIILEEGASEENVTQAEEVAHKADSYCIVTNAVRDKIEVLVYPTVVRDKKDGD
jgi:peroxiredoxin-like protein